MIQTTDVRTVFDVFNVDLDLLDNVIAQYFPEDRDQAITDLCRAKAGIDFMCSLLHSQPEPAVRILIQGLHETITDLMVGNVQDNGII